VQILVWSVTLLLLGLWSLLAWGTHALLTLDPSWIGELEPLIAQWPPGDWLEVWLPGWQQWVQTLLELVQTALRHLGALAGIVVWSAWGLGALALLLPAALASWALAAYERRRPAGGTAPAA
jgi:hypothetical protein